MYYRIENSFIEYSTVLEPKDCFEMTDENGNISYTQEDDNSIEIDTSYIPELCFSKDILGAFFGKRQYLKEGHRYYIYGTEEVPDTDLSHNHIFDFATIQEVRYRRSIEAKLIGTVEADGFLIHNLNRIDESICYDLTTYHYDNEKGRELMKEMAGFLEFIDWYKVSP